MSRFEGQDISPGNVLEFFESKEILCGVVLSVKDSRFHVLSERNREISLTGTRVIHHGKLLLDLKLSRDELVQKLAAISQSRRELAENVPISEIWSLLSSEDAGFDYNEIAEFIFSTPVSENHSAAVQRLLLADRLFFQARDSLFYPRTPENVELRRAELEREADRERKLEEGARWITSVLSRKQNSAPIPFRDELVSAIKDYALLGQEARENLFIKELFKLAGLPPQPHAAFRLLVRLGVWREDENILLYEHGISREVPLEVLEQADAIIQSDPVGSARNQREDLTGLDIFTVDSLLTRDYDDALSVRKLGGGLFEVGIHIADAACSVPPGSPLDREAERRASSIYLPDERICMLPASLSEGIFSLKAGEDRLALSFLITLDSDANIHETRTIPSIVRIHEQLTYQDVNARVEDNENLRALYELALKRRSKRLDRGAIILPLPEIQVSVNSVGMIQVSRYAKETPSQVLVSEWMIEANAAAADYLAERAIPAVFRAQAECRQETQFVQSENPIFHIYRQRRLFSRAELCSAPKPHCSLAITNYTTVTSPIRRYSDLIVQRQLKHALATDSPFYTKEALDRLITGISTTQAQIFTIQRKWTRYWIFKYIEQEDIETLDALVLDKNPRYAHLLLPDFLLEINAQVPENHKFQQGDNVRIRVEKIIPREDVLKVQILDTPGRN